MNECIDLALLDRHSLFMWGTQICSIAGKAIRISKRILTNFQITRKRRQDGSKHCDFCQVGDNFAVVDGCQYATNQLNYAIFACFVDVFDNAESKVFLEGHYCEIYYVFNDVFSIVEANLRQKGAFCDFCSLVILNTN